MKKLLFIAFTILSVSISSCSNDSDEVVGDSIVGKWMEKTVAGQHERFAFTFYSNGTGKMDVVDLISEGNPSFQSTFTYKANYNNHWIDIDWTGDYSGPDLSKEFTLTNGSVLIFWEMTLYKQ